MMKVRRYALFALLPALLTQCNNGGCAPTTTETPIATAAPPATVPPVTTTAATGYTGWWYYDVQGNDACTWDFEVYLIDGNATGNTYWDLNNDCRWDSLTEDAGNDGQWDLWWFGHIHPDSPNWDFVMDNTTIWRGQNEFAIGKYFMYPGPDNTQWAYMGNYQTTVGGVPTGDGWYNLMVAMARQSGVSMWPGAVNDNGCYDQYGNWNYTCI
jgi:hypothetical protein